MSIHIIFVPSNLGMVDSLSFAPLKENSGFKLIKNENDKNVLNGRHALASCMVGLHEG
jgi:hypothetical protein